MRDEPIDDPDPTLQTSERRGYVRYPRRLDTLWQLLGLAPRDLAGGQLLDVSTGGVGLLVDRSFPAGTSLLIRLPTARRGWESHLVRVRRCEPTEDGRFLLGCQFIKPLAPEQLRAHLE